ncbi:CAP domain-containing protein [Hypoxylon trugodes]|uniref:CAP domain-containing protein n=1 Tax=Hypoxylon trugodes TaxID=326681 RepID=UPI002196341A|nr:CAP domain-containing protein [Hypoxylon trugodes]KAI1382986.1 CAP domain-containing protein [Hypoxylon trugodes]
MKSTQVLAYAVMAIAGADGKPCSRKLSSTSSSVANASATASSASSPYSASSIYSGLTDSSSSSTAPTSSTESIISTSSLLFTPTSTVSVPETTSSFATQTTSSSASSSAISTSSTSTSSLSTSSLSTSSTLSTSSFSSTTTSSSSSSSTISTSTSSTSSAPPAIQTISTTGLSWMDAIALVHNTHRRNHTADDLTWSVDLSNTAATLANTCIYQHNTIINGGGYGQVIAAGYTAGQITIMLNEVYKSGLQNYPQPYGVNNPDLSNFASWGNFAQILWAATTQVGCAVQYCPGGLQNAAGIPPYFTVCNYSPAGNIVGQFSNVHAPLGQPSVEFAEWVYVPEK